MLYPAELRAHEAVTIAGACYVQKTTIANPERERKLGCGGWCRRWSCEHRDGLNDIQPCAAKKLVNDGLVEAAGVELDPYGPGGFIERHLAYSVDLAYLSHGKRSGLGGRHSVTIQDIKLCHISIISATCDLGHGRISVEFGSRKVRAMRGIS